MSNDTVLWEIDRRGVATVTLNRPKVNNAYNGDLIQGLHDAIKGLFPTSSGNMHIKSSPFWDMGLAVRFTESLGYKGLYSIEVGTHPAVRIVYNTIVASL